MRAIFTLIFIVWSRFFGLFVVLPVISVYVDASALATGLAVGAYALSQIIFALPFGKLSDHIGRKKALALGIFIFGLGSIVCALSSEIFWLIVGRFIQGAGAVGAVASAFIADLVPDEKKSRYMAALGAGVGMAFVAAMLVGPALASFAGLNALFWLCAALCLLSLILLYFVPDLKAHIHTEPKIPARILLKNKNISLLCLSNFLQKMFLNIFFVALGPLLVLELGFERGSLWQVYALSAFFGFLAMGVSGAFGDKGKAKEIFFGSLAFFALSFSVIVSSSHFGSVIGFFIAACLFFVAFSLQEPILQSQMSKTTKANRGAALGLLNAAGYAGSFAGSILGAFSSWIFFVLLGVCAFWFFALKKLERI